MKLLFGFHAKSLQQHFLSCITSFSRTFTNRRVIVIANKKVETSKTSSFRFARQQAEISLLKSQSLFCLRANNFQTKHMSTIPTTKDEVAVSETKLTANSSEQIEKVQGDKPVSKRTMKRQARAQLFKELKKRRKAENLVQTGREDAGYNLTEFDKTSYYFENGLRKVYPYHYVFATYAKGRWVGRTLKNVLEKEFGFDEPEDVDKAFHQGKIHVNGIQAEVDYVVKDCDYISHQIHRHENPVTDRPLEIIADTEDVVVINKPSSIPCHPCGRYRFNSVVFILGKEMGYSHLRNIYRLDRLTSGVLVMGKTAEITRKLEDQVVNRQVQKEYVCRVEGEFPSETLTVDQPLKALSNKLRLQVVASNGKSSQTTFTRLSFNGRSSVVKCVPHTGRTHQIRVHLQYLGHPIINDVFYCSDAWGPNKGKGGVYEVPDDIVCSTILKRHQATQWEGGENPRFYEKLKEMEQQQQQQQKQQPEKPAPSDGEEDKRDTLSGTDSSLDQTVSVGDQGDDKNNVKDLNHKHTTSLMDDTTCSLPDNTRQSQEDKLESVLASDSKATSNNNVVSSDDNSNLVPVSSADSTEKTQQVRHHGFDWTKWQVESSCDMCRKTTLDPKPRDLVMFLHAWKYKGPDWAYQTELPAWAHKDWQDEDQYVLGMEEMTDGNRSADGDGNRSMDGDGNRSVDDTRTNASSMAQDTNTTNDNT